LINLEKKVMGMDRMGLNMTPSGCGNDILLSEQKEIKLY
jgi:hypothetical protein